MPRLCSDFYGISVYLYFKDIDQHHLPHVHAFHGDDEAVFALNGDVLEGDLQSTARKRVRAWLAQEHSGIQKAWELAAIGKPFQRVNSLR